MSARANDARSTRGVVGLAVPAIGAALALLVAPRLSVSLPVAEALTFLGGAALGVFGVTAAARSAWSPRLALGAIAASVAVLVAIALASVRSRWAIVAVDTALVALATAVGASIGARVQKPGHLLPAAAVAAAADVVSVAVSWGPSHAIASSERALAVLAVSFPVPGTAAVAPALGVGDLVFVALVLGAARAHALPYARASALAFAGVLVAGIGSALLGVPVPALPTVGLLVVLGIPAARKVERRDRTVTTIAVGTSFLVAAWAIVSALAAPK